MTTRTLYMIRHGQYDTTVTSVDGGNLTEIGREQAYYTGQSLARLPIDKVHTSTMTRAVETAGIISEQLSLDYKTYDNLREAIPTIPPRIATNILEYMESNPSFTHDNINQDKKRADDAFSNFFCAPSDEALSTHELLVCHGNIIRYLVCKALDINVDTWAKMNINHCGMSIITVDIQGRCRLINHNTTGHLPNHLVTE